MTIDEIREALAALEQHLASRREVWRVIVDEHGQEIGRYYTGSFIDSKPVTPAPDAPSPEPQKEP